VEPTCCDRGKQKGHPVKHVVLITAALTIRFLSDTYAGSPQDKRMAAATPSPLPAGRRLRQDLGCLACTLDHVESIMPTQQPRGRALTRAQKAANRRIARRRVRIAHGNRRINAAVSSVPRTACGRWVSAIWSWKFAVRCITFACVCCPGNQ
jgi:hypothetical protein